MPDLAPALDSDPTAVSRTAARGIVLPCVLTFTSSFCVMAIELAASRMVAMYVGAGLYTWTSVIGIVLAGITVGNLAGGRLADRFDARKTLSVLFFAAGAAAFALPFVNYWVGRWFEWEVANDGSFPLRVAGHTLLVFLLPSAMLGLIGPAVAKFALEAGGGKGRTLGRVSACGALGSIVGTFVAGFYLIGAAGTNGVVLGAGALLAFVSLALAPRVAAPLFAVGWPLLTGCIAGSILTSGRASGVWVWNGQRLAVREQSQQDRIFVDESEYSFIRVAENPYRKTRSLFLDNLLHALYKPEAPGDLEYGYELVYASITERFGHDRDGLRALFIGGGGYIFPRYMKAKWPKSSIQVAEIDPAVTEANFAAFGLKRDEVRVLEPGAEVSARADPGLMEVYHLDARNHVEDLLRRKRVGAPFEPFDFVYGDAFNDYCVPFHLVTEEFARGIQELLRPETGIYLINVIDIYASGKFLGAMYNTLRRVFPRVYILTGMPGGPDPKEDMRDTFIIACALRDLDLADLGKRPGERPFTGAVFQESHLQALEARSRGVVLTDDYSPVENLLEEPVRRRLQKEKP